MFPIKAKKEVTVEFIANEGPCSEGATLRKVVTVFEQWAVSYEYYVRGGDYSDQSTFEEFDRCEYVHNDCLVGEAAVQWSIPF